MYISAYIMKFMKKTFYSFLMFVAFLEAMFVPCAYALNNKFTYIGKDTYGSAWYLDTSSFKCNLEDKEEKFMDFEITTEAFSPYRHGILDLLATKLGNGRKAFDLFTHTSRISYHYVYDIKRGIGCVNYLLFYSEKERLMYNIHLGVSANKWDVIPRTSIAGQAIAWILRETRQTSAFNLEYYLSLLSFLRYAGPEPLSFFSTKRSVQQPQSSNFDTLGVLIFSLLVGIIVSALAIFAYKTLLSDVFPTANIDNDKETDTQEQTANYMDIDFTEIHSDDSFDYPHEDIGDVLKQ